MRDRLYIGSSIDYSGRKRCHLRMLRNNKHHSFVLQKHYNKYGENDMAFAVIEIVPDRSKLITREQYHLDKLNPVFNICKTAGNTLGVRPSEETRAKLSAWQIGRKLPQSHVDKLRGIKQSSETIAKRLASKKGKPGPRTGTKQSDHCKMLLRLKQTGKPKKSKTKKHHDYIRDQLKTRSQGSIAKELGIHQSTVSRIIKSWKN